MNKVYKHRREKRINRKEKRKKEKKKSRLTLLAEAAGVSSGTATLVMTYTLPSVVTLLPAER